MSTPLRIDEWLRLDGGTQMRTGLNGEHLETLTLALEQEGELDPVEVIHDGTYYWLWDGFHRVQVYSDAGRHSIPANVTKGDQRDAILAAARANLHEARLARNQDDIRRAIEALLRDDEWSKWPDTKVCEAVGLKGGWGRLQVADVRRNLSCLTTRTRTVERGGVSYDMDLGRIRRGENDPPAAALMPGRSVSTRQPAPDGIAQRILIPPEYVARLIAQAEAEDCDTETICLRAALIYLDAQKRPPQKPKRRA